MTSLLLHACRSSSWAGEAEDGLWPGSSSNSSNNSSADGVVSGHGGLLRPAMTYGEYAQGCAKRAGATTVRQVLGAMMRQVPGCSAARAEALVRAFQSPLGLMLALERAAEGGGDGDDDDAARMKRVDALLAGLACRGGAGTNKLPQPLRRLLCRLFVGESIGDDDDDDDDDDDGARAGEVAFEAGGHHGVVYGNEEGSAGLLGGGFDPYPDPDPRGSGWEVEPMSQDGDPYS